MHKTTDAVASVYFLISKNYVIAYDTHIHTYNLAHAIILLRLR